MKKIIGYIVWKAIGPQRNVRSKGSWRERTEPIKVYKTQSSALRYGGDVRPVYVDID